MQTPGALLARINDRVAADIPEKMFVTCLYAILDPNTGHLHYANAGHDVAYCWTAGAGQVSELRARGMPRPCSIAASSPPGPAPPGHNAWFGRDVPVTRGGGGAW